VWAGVGRSTATLEEFFDALGEDRSAQITHVLADGTPFIAKVVAQRCPNAIRMADPFHVVKWATDALNDVRRQSWNEARQLAGAEPKRPRGRPAADAPPAPQSQRAKGLKGARFALLKNPEDLTQNQTHKLAWIVKADPRLYRAYLLKEGLRAVFKLPVDAAGEALDGWISWAKRCRIPEFVKLQRTIVKHQDQTLAAIEHRLSNGLIESTNTKIGLMTQMAFGFKSADALIALAMLSLGAHRPVLPGRPLTETTGAPGFRCVKHA
ncbi:MAG: transposase, partial [Yaniella sp.]|nr:transposase [Yaniella sp.]